MRIFVLALAFMAQFCTATTSRQPLEGRQLLRPSLTRSMKTPLRGGSTKRSALKTALSTNGGGMEDQCSAAYGWMSDLGGPASLVAGAAIASFFELRERLVPEDGDSHLVKAMKSVITMLLLSSFCLEIACLYVGTITGDQLMSNGNIGSATLGVWQRGIKKVNCVAESAGGMMFRELEFEYLASRVGFFQGIVNWIFAISGTIFLEGWTIDPKTADKKALASRKLSLIASYGTLSLALWMLAFYNWHLPFYENYMHVMTRFAQMTWTRYVWHPGAPRFMAIAAFLPLLASGWYTAQVCLDTWF